MKASLAPPRWHRWSLILKMYGSSFGSVGVGILVRRFREMEAVVLGFSFSERQRLGIRPRSLEIDRCFPGKEEAMVVMWFTAYVYARSVTGETRLCNDVVLSGGDSLSGGVSDRSWVA
ncbi:Uncharacterized protein Rs2_43998 [Raphanus sativus]|nr:Uncharacterized protein Rs2_43998 [Raphanus sativus]